MPLFHPSFESNKSYSSLPQPNKHHLPLPGNKTTKEREHQMMEISLARADQFAKKVDPALKLDEIQMGVNANYAFFLVKAAIGQPVSSTFTLMLDTGSDLTWVQSVDCHDDCIPLTRSFEYRYSYTFEEIGCQEAECYRGDEVFCTHEKYCGIEYAYLGGNSFRGRIARDNFRFLSRNGEPISLRFGVCDRTNAEFNDGFGPTSQIAGIFGLSLGFHSFLWQYKVFQDRSLVRFSYCLPAQLHETTLLSFGKDAFFGYDEAFKSTPFIKGPSAGYYLNCTGISVGGVDIGLPLNTFTTFTGRGEGGFVIDSGTPYTHIAHEPFAMIEKEVIKFISRYSSAKVTRENGFTCFRSLNHVRQLPDITFQFESNDYPASYTVEPGLLFQRVEGKLHCLAILSTRKGVSLLGGLFQRNYKIMYDISKQQLSFYPTEC